MINFMIRKAGGWICLALTGERADQLELAQQTEDNTDEYRTAFTISIDADERFGITTGVSAQDRAKTIRVAVDPKTVPTDLRRPGHVPPLRARDGGVLPELDRFAQEHGLTFITVAQLVAHRLQTERLVHRVAEARLPLESGEWRVVGYRNDVDNHEHIALVYGDVGPDSSVLVRMHSKCLTGDVFHSLRCDCGWQLDTAMKMIAKEGKGVIVYLDQEGRGIGLLNKLKAYELQDQGSDTVEANERLGFKPDLRNYGIGAQILLDLGLKKIRPITNNPRKLVGLEGYGLTIDDRVPIISIAHDENSSYLEAKRSKLGHLFAS